MNPVFISVAVGRRASLEVLRLKARVTGLDIVFSGDPRVSPAEDEYLSGVLTKTAAAGFHAEHPGPVVLMDSDLIPQADGPFDNMEWPKADVAFVPYPWKTHHHDPEVIAALEKYPMVNSGLLVFRTGEVAARVAGVWSGRYAETAGKETGNRIPNDEWSLLLALNELGVSHELLPPTWNDWGQFGEAVEGAVFSHRHATEDEFPVLERIQVEQSPAGLLATAERDGLAVPFVGGTITLAAGEKDRALFSQALILFREAEDLQPDETAKAAYRESEVTLADSAGATHTLTIAQARALLVSYGAAYHALWTAAR